MLLQLTASLEEIIVKALGTNPWVTANWLHEQIAKEHGDYSLRGIYKELNKLEREGIVVKVRGKYSLRLAWVVHLISFVDGLYQKYLDPGLLSSLLLSGQNKITWHFNDLRKMDMAWTQLMLGLHRACPGKAMCIWCPHQWFDLSHGEKQRQFMKANELVQNRRYHIIGGQSYLDKLCLPYLPKCSCHSFAAGPFENERSTYYTLIGDYIITVKLDKKTTAAMEDLFVRVKTARDAASEDFAGFFSRVVKARLILEINHARALRLKRKFADFLVYRLQRLAEFFCGIYHADAGCRLLSAAGPWTHTGVPSPAVSAGIPSGIRGIAAAKRRGFPASRRYWLKRWLRCYDHPQHFREDTLWD